MSFPVLNIVADDHIWGAASAFSAIPGFAIDLTLLEHHRITPQALAGADVLLTRSSTRVGRELLAGTPLRFVATATIGDDHYDKQWLDRQGIVWANAAGSSTGSVIEYMLSVLLELHARRLLSMPETVVGIVGVGRIGSRLADICASLGMPLLLNDPPRERAGGEGLVELDRLQAEADIITLHTPLIREGQDRTQHLIDAAFLQNYRGRGIINAARGSCVDNDALLAWLEGDSTRWAVLDCWEGEPQVSQALLSHPQLVIATPHIAGHSLDGKAANTQFVYNALCGFLNVEPLWNAADHLPAAEPVEFGYRGNDLWDGLSELARLLYPVMSDDAVMRSWSRMEKQAAAAAFSRYRRNYPERRSWARIPVSMSATSRELETAAEKIGIELIG